MSSSQTVPMTNLKNNYSGGRGLKLVLKVVLGLAVVALIATLQHSRPSDHQNTEEVSRHELVKTKNVRADACARYFCVKYGRKCHLDLGLYSIRSSTYRALIDACAAEASSGNVYPVHGETCGCSGVTCAGPACDDVRAPSCPLVDPTRAVCTSPVVEEIYDTGTTVGNVLAGLDTGSALIGLLPLLKAFADSPIPGVSAVITAILGFTGNLAMTGETAYNLMLQKLAEEVIYLHECIDHRFATNRVQNINGSLRAVKTDLARAQATPGGMTILQQINVVWQPGSTYCDQIMTDVQEFVRSNTAQKENWLELLAILNGATQLCVSLWTGFIVDIQAGGSQTSHFSTSHEKVSVQDFAWEMRTTAQRGVTELSAYWMDITRCGYPSSARTKAHEAVRTLENNLVAPIFALHEATLGGTIHTACVYRHWNPSSVYGVRNGVSHAFGQSHTEVNCVLKCMSSRNCTGVSYNYNTRECIGFFNGLGVPSSGSHMVYTEVGERGLIAGVSFWNNHFGGYNNEFNVNLKPDSVTNLNVMTDWSTQSHIHSEGECQKWCAKNYCPAAYWYFHSNGGSCLHYSGNQASFSVPSSASLEIFFPRSIVVRLNGYSWSGKSGLTGVAAYYEHECVLRCATTFGCLGLDFVSGTRKCYIYEIGKDSYPGTQKVVGDSSCVHYDVMSKDVPIAMVKFDDPVPNTAVTSHIAAVLGDLFHFANGDVSWMNILSFFGVILCGCGVGLIHRRMTLKAKGNSLFGVDMDLHDQV